MNGSIEAVRVERCAQSHFKWKKKKKKNVFARVRVVLETLRELLFLVYEVKISPKYTAVS